MRIFTGEKSLYDDLMQRVRSATYVEVHNCTGLTALPAATHVEVYNCPGLTALPELPAATYARVYNCRGLSTYGGTHRGYDAYAVKMRGGWVVVAGCQNFTFGEARDHWAKDTVALAIIDRLEKLTKDIGP